MSHLRVKSDERRAIGIICYRLATAVRTELKKRKNSEELFLKVIRLGLTQRTRIFVVTFWKPNTYVNLTF